MTKGIPFVKIADTVEVTVDLKGKRVSSLRWSLSNRQHATLRLPRCDANYGVWWTRNL